MIVTLYCRFNLILFSLTTNDISNLHIPLFTIYKLWDMVKERKAWCATIHGVKKSQTWLSDWTAICHLWFSSLFKFDSYKDWWYINEMPNFYQKFHCISLLLPHVQHLQQLDLIIQTIAIRGLGTLEFKYPSIFHLLSWRHTIQFIIQAIFLCFDIVLFNIRLGPSVL